MTTALAPPRMADEMAEQPAALRRIAGRRAALHERIAAVTPRGLHGTAFVGRGSSANAALCGRVLTELATARPAFLVSPSLWRLYHPATDYRGYLAVGVSQSGRTPEVVAALGSVSSRGAATMALTADPRSPLAVAADLCVDLDIGAELAVPTTKAFTAQLAALVVLTEALSGTAMPDDHWLRAADAVESVLATPGQAERLAARLDGITHLSVVGAGLFLGIAEEVALKLRETAVVVADAYSAAEYRHGPIAVAGPEHPVVAIAGPGAAGRETMAAVRDLRDQGVPVAVVGTGGHLHVPGGLPACLATLPLAVRGQQLALALALRRGHDPDHPDRLTKVTAT